MSPLPSVGVDRGPSGDACKPRTQRTGRVVAFSGPPGLQEGLLSGFLGQTGIAEDLVRHRVDQTAVAPVDIADRFRISRAKPYG